MTYVTLSREMGFSCYGVPILFSLFFEGHSHVIPENRLKSNKASGTLLFVSGIWGGESLFGVPRGVDFSRQSIFQSIIDYVVLLRGRAQKIDQVPLQVQVNHHEPPNQHHAQINSMHRK